MRMKFFSIGVVVFMYCISPISMLVAQRLSKTSDDASNFYTNIGKIGLTITNFGTVGTRNSNWPDQPSCEYPLGSRIEHMYQGGLWIGGRLRNSSITTPLVSTGVTDRSSTSGEGYEFTTEIGSTMNEISSQSSSSHYSDFAISHQDFICDYTDIHTRVPLANQIGDSIPNHHPLGLYVHQESYAWNFPFTNNWVIISYTIKNVGADTLDDVYVGLYLDDVVRNTNQVRPTIGSTYFAYCGEGYDSLARMMYTFEGNKSPGDDPANSYIGIALLGTTPFPAHITNINNLTNQTFYNVWSYRYSGTVTELYSPQNDFDPVISKSRYGRLTQSTPNTPENPILSTYVYGHPGNFVSMISTGPWTILAPGDSIQIAFAIVCADKYGTEDESKNTASQRHNLNMGIDWAQRCYQGEDMNGNNVLDPGEDILTRIPGGFLTVPDGKLTRLVLPTPPAQPIVHVEAGNQKAILYWDRSAEFSRDPISGKNDFEGYRIYRSAAGTDFLNNQNWLTDVPLVGDFDRSDDTIGYNTGFNKIIIDTTLPPGNAVILHDHTGKFSGVQFPGDTTKYFYQFPPAGTNVSQLNGWQYLYGVSSYDQGDPSNNLNSLESAMRIVTIVTGTKPTSDQTIDVGVYPNPYYAHAYWENGGASERNRKVIFYNLPATATITIYTIAGDIVAQLDHSSTNVGGDINWFSAYGGGQKSRVTTGGEHAWDLLSKHEQAIASGLYLFTVEDKATHAVKRGKFLIVK